MTAYVIAHRRSDGDDPVDEARSVVDHHYRSQEARDRSLKSEPQRAGRHARLQAVPSLLHCSLLNTDSAYANSRAQSSYRLHVRRRGGV